MRRTSPCTRIIGGRPDDRCRSDALFLTTKASSSVRSITILPRGAAKCFFFAGSTHYGGNRGKPASCESAPGARSGGDFVGSFEGAAARAHPGGSGGRPESLRRELRAGSAAENGRDDRLIFSFGVAPDRPAPEQQDAPRGGALRLGADCGQ